MRFSSEADLRWFYGAAQVLFERSPVSAMIERHGIYGKRAIEHESKARVKRGQSPLEYGEPERPKTRGINRPHRLKDFVTVNITAEVRASQGHEPNLDELERYGRMSHLTLALGRVQPIHEQVTEAYFGVLGESYEAGLLIEAPELKAKADAKPALTIGIETKRKEQGAVRKKGPGRIASLFHLTPTGKILLATNSRDAVARGANIALKDEVAMKNMLAVHKVGKELHSSILRMSTEAMAMLLRASEAWDRIVAAERERAA